MSFRYHPVYVENALGTTYSLCEVYLDESGSLSSWTENPAMTPVGNDMDDLKGSLIKMLFEADKWEPVKHDDLHVGMKFNRREPTP